MITVVFLDRQAYFDAIGLTNVMQIGAASFPPAQSTVTRETFWTISGAGKVLFYALSTIAIAIFLFGIYRRITRYTRGAAEPIDRFTNLTDRIRTSARMALSNEGQFDRDWVAGLMHTFIMWGFLVLLIATSILFIDESVRGVVGSFWTGDLYLAYQFAVDAFGLLFVVGLGMAIYRRYWVRMDRLWGEHTTTEDDLFVLSLAVIGVSGLLLEGLRIYGTGMPAFEVVSFVGYGLATVFNGLGLSERLAATLHWGVWWGHALISLAFIAWIPYAKPVHMLTSAMNVVVRDDTAGARLPGVPADLDAETGASSIEEFTWKELLDQDACTNCGRCSSVCPANDVGRNLDPRNVILDLKAHRERVDADPAADETAIIADGGVIETETMEACMSCMACMDACPVEIEHLKSFTRMNRQLVEQGDVDGNIQEVFGNLMQRGNTFGDAQRKRADWAAPLDIDPPDAREESVEYLWYVGDYPSFDDRNQQVAQALAQVFEAAGVDWGILFEDEQYDGNDVRRLGEELLYVDLAGHHVETFDACEFETIVCTDPHSYNTMKHEYPEIDFAEFGAMPITGFEYDQQWNQDGAIDVHHWTQVVADLYERGEFTVPQQLDYTVTYHDPCHLGRYNDEYEAPRRLITATGCELVEMPRNRADAYCCGGGGGGLWLDQDQDSKPSEERLREATEETAAGSAVDKFVVACPMCMTMYEDGRKTGGYEDAIEIVDVSELLIEALETSPSSS